MARRVEVGIDETILTNDDGNDVEGICATCSLCGHQTESYGTSEKSVKRCLALMREECPEEQANFYVED